jgi:hypothetical protein
VANANSKGRVRSDLERFIGSLLSTLYRKNKQKSTKMLRFM